MKSLKFNNLIVFLLIFVLFISSNTVLNANESTQSMQSKTYTDHIIFTVGSKEIYHNKQQYLANNPITIRQGVTYIPLRVLAERLGLSVSYDNQTKVAKISNEEIELRFQVNRAQYQVNNQGITSTHGIPFIENQTMMIPLRTFVTHFNMRVHPELKQNFVHLYWSTKPVANFSVQPATIYAGQTRVTYIDEYKHPQNFGIVDEVWEGKQEVFAAPGTYTVTRRVKDQNGIWSDPFKVKVNVLPEPQPPVAKFSTDKDQYLIGEPIIYTDLSYDDEDDIVKRAWTNKEPAFFSAGKQEIVLEVVDQHGLKSTYTKKIVIKEEVLYTSEEFYPLFIPVGQKYLIAGQNIISYPIINYEIENEEHTLYHSNSPESIRQEGIYYRGVVQGNGRVMLHKQNNRKNPVNIYIVATNIYDEPVEIKIPHIGMAGPHEWVTTTGKLALARYFDTFAKPNQKSVILEPGERKVILPEVSQKRILERQTLSVYADLTTSLPLQIETVVLDRGKDLFEHLPLLPDLPRDGIHTRGTFLYGNRSIRIGEMVGDDAKRIVFGDRYEDKPVAGIDQMTGEYVLNRGNFGVLYQLKLERVAPESIILVNGRGGYYSGAFLVNNEVVMVTAGSHLLNSNEAAVLYRTGEEEEIVDIVFKPASGSNLPINIVIQPLPEKRH
ncbi:PKD repeat protein [Desulfitispora alkaliphila]